MTPTREISAPIAGGDPAAAFALANDLLTAAEASQGDFFQAVALIDQAAAAGHPDATERRAVFEAAGVARPQSWETAFDALQRAAELGSESARRQLVFLADTSVDPLLPSGVPASFWSERRCEISLDRLLSYGE